MREYKAGVENAGVQYAGVSIEIGFLKVNSFQNAQFRQ